MQRRHLPTTPRSAPGFGRDPWADLGVPLIARLRRTLTAATVLAVLTVFVAATPTIDTPARAADPAPVFDEDAHAERLWQLQLQRASRNQAVSGFGTVDRQPVEAATRSQPRQPKASGQPSQPAKKPPAKKPPTKKPATSSKPAAPPVKASGNLGAVVAFALRQQGKPYIYASAGPTGFDCSGLVKAAYAQIGVHLPHQSEQIRARGTVIPRAQWVPGTILWAPGHVGIFLGGNQMIHASRPGKPIAVVTIYQSFTGLRVT